MRSPSFVWLISHLRLSANGKPVECLWCAPQGTVFFVRHIGELRVDPEMLEQVVANFEPDREPPRVPINVNHQGDSGDLDQARAIGWIVDLQVKRTDERVSLLFTPHWSDDAREVIEDGGFRFVSVGMDLGHVDAETGEAVGPKLREVSVTNSPAIPDLAPIELSVPLDLESRARVAALNAVGPDGEPDLLDLAQQIATAFFQAYPDTDGCCWGIEAVWLDARQMVVREMVRQVSAEGEKVGDRMWRVGFEIADGTATFAAREEWQQVRQEFVAVTSMPAERLRVSDVPVAAAAVQKDTTEILTEEPEMDPETEKKIREALNLAEHDDIVEHVSMMASKMAEMAQMVEDLQKKLAEAEGTAAAAAEKAGKQLSDRDHQVVALADRADKADGRVVELTSRIEALEGEKRRMEAKAAIDSALAEGKLVPAEVEGDDAPMRKIALADPAQFKAILDRRPKSALTVQLSTDGEPETDLDPAAFWKLVDSAVAENPKLSRTQARQVVLSQHPEYESLFQAANQAVKARISKA